jgi:NAD(P)H-hydrate repair Nnr-like enzyme with NAD(P)H-hydrate epimerase domain
LLARRYVAVASKSVRGKVYFGVVQDFTYQSYAICCGRGDVDGDGITPLECALALDGAHKVLLTGAKHLPTGEADGGGWYGSDGFLQQWQAWLDPPPQQQ